MRPWHAMALGQDMLLPCGIKLSQTSSVMSYHETACNVMSSVITATAKKGAEYFIGIHMLTAKTYEHRINQVKHVLYTSYERHKWRNHVIDVCA